jgi:glycosyltransferase involved in cell wall biosynthesis
MVSDNLFPKITIVTPSFNQGIYLEECIKSVVNQNYPNLEYIIMDGGSTDESISIIKKYSKYLSYWQSQSDGGQADAIKEGLTKGTGEIYAWLNSDDLMCNNALWEVGKTFSNNPRLGFICGDAFLIDTKTELIRTLIPGEIDYQRLVYGAASLFQGSVFFSSHAYHQVGGINPNLTYSMEYELFFKIAQAYEIKYIPKFLACFRKQPLSKTANLKKIGKEESQKVLREVCQIELESYEYKLKQFYLSTERRIKQIITKKFWKLDNFFYRQIFDEQLSHLY